jgi:hypothetical protein
MRDIIVVSEVDEVSGTWAYMGMASSFTGRRR